MKVGIDFKEIIKIKKWKENEFIKFTIIMTMFNVLLARVYFCCHYFLDTIVGFLIGITISFIFNQIYLTLSWKKYFYLNILKYFLPYTK
jgi:membrane-associated phospholipid phosphatase